MVDLSNITTAGFKGKDPWTILTKLVQAGSSYGIIWLDEADKRMVHSRTASGENISAEIQGQLLSIVAGIEADYQLKSMNTPVSIDTSLTMFVALGAFDMVRMHKKEMRSKTIGFINNDAKYDTYDEISREDIISVGCIREMLGRFPLLINYHKLSREAVERIVEINRAKVAEELVIRLYLSEDFVEEAIENSNGPFGCRLLSSMMYQPALYACKDALMQEMEYPEVILHRQGKFEIKGFIVETDEEEFD